MNDFSTYVFDVDGTLAQTNELIFESFRYVSKKYLNKNVSNEEIISLFGPSEDVILKELMHDDFHSARKDYFEFYMNEHDRYVKNFDGLKDILELLQSNNKNLAVFTGKGTESANITLEKIGFANFFEILSTGDNVKNHKPAPDGIINILEHYNIPESELLMIGDSPHDVEASNKANVKIASVVWDSYAPQEVEAMNPDYIFYTVEEFKSFIESTLKN